MEIQFDLLEIIGVLCRFTPGSTLTECNAFWKIPTESNMCKYKK